jgi:WD40 repeat protein/predicted negative regulator of RcsB-dependent stress response
MKKSIEIFFSYAHEDEQLKEELIKHLSEWKRQDLISPWHHRDISAGTEWQREIDTHLRTAQIILLLISPDFMASDYCNSIEVKQAMERYASGDIEIIPILLRPVEWKDAPFGTLPAFPQGSKPVTLWASQDEAFRLVAAQIKTVVENLLVTQSLNAAEEYLQKQQYAEAIDTYRTVIELRPASSAAYHGQGKSFAACKQYEDARKAYNKALSLDNENSTLYLEGGDILCELKQYDRALLAYDRALHLNPQDPSAYIAKGYAYLQLHRYQEALVAYEHALQIRSSASYGEKGDALENLRLFKQNILMTVEQLLPSLLLSHQPTLSSSFIHDFPRGTFDCLQTIHLPPATSVQSIRTMLIELREGRNFSSLAPSVPASVPAMEPVPGFVEGCAIAIDPNEEFIACKYDDQEILIYNVKDTSLVQRISILNPSNKRSDNKSFLSQLFFNSDGKTLIGSMIENNVSMIKVWDVKSGKLLRKFMVGDAPGQLGTIAMDFEQQILVGVENSKITVMDFTTGEKLRQSQHETTDYLNHLAVSCSSGIIVSAGTVNGRNESSLPYCFRSHEISLWDLQTLQRLHIMVLPGNVPEFECNALAGIAISFDGRILASCHTNGLVKLWSLPGGQHIRTFAAYEHENAVTSVAFSSNGQKLVTCSQDGTIKIWGKK